MSAAQVFIAAGNGSKEAAQAIADSFPKNYLQSFEYCGKVCFTDGTQLIEKHDLDNMDYDSLEQLPPIIIAFPEGSYEQAKMKPLPDSLDDRIDTLAYSVAISGSPIGLLGQWLRGVLALHGEDISDGSEKLIHYSNVVIKRIFEIDTNATWLANACVGWFAESTGEDPEVVAEQYNAMSNKERATFVENTAETMGFKVRLGVPND